MFGSFPTVKGVTPFQSTLGTLHRQDDANVSASGLPTLEKIRNFESAFNNKGLDEAERRVGRVKRFTRPQYLVEPQWIEGPFEESVEQLDPTP